MYSILKKELKQGDSLSCHELKISLEKAIRDSGVQTRKTIFVKSVQLIAFADDIDIMGRTKVATVEAFSALGTAAKT
ncbi:hypothetical protein TNCV_3036451 [Trichonephila clavipes]|nr:hypothetical protein TNCV_3036451 [Trichonephila clavipes]